MELQVGMFGERLQVTQSWQPVPGVPIGIEVDPAITQLRKRCTVHMLACPFYPWEGGRVLYLMAQGIVG